MEGGGDGEWDVGGEEDGEEVEEVGEEGEREEGGGEEREGDVVVDNDEEEAGGGRENEAIFPFCHCSPKGAYTVSPFHVERSSPLG